MHRIKILGLGPGHSDYVMPITIKYIKDSQILIGGKRNIESLGKLADNKEIKYIDRHLDELSIYIKDNRDKKISLIVSGDPGFYSMTAFMVRNFGRDEIDIISGISSIQYMFSAISYSYEDTFIGSVHGRTCDYVIPMKEGKNIGLLTDKKITPQVIAKTLVENNIEGTIFVGERLSYDNEKLTSMDIKEMQNLDTDFEINVVVVINKKL